jgi:hypothetical protein
MFSLSFHSSFKSSFQPSYSGGKGRRIMSLRLAPARPYLKNKKKMWREGDARDDPRALSLYHGATAPGPT